MVRRIDRSATLLFPPAESSAPDATGVPFGPELELWREGIAVIGTDEAGRGPLAGPVVAAAVAFPPNVRLEGIGDSKVLARKTRERLFDEIRSAALAFSIMESSPARIDEINILAATREAMDRAVHEVARAIGAEWPVVLVDGRIPRLSIGQHRNIIKGDSLSFTIGAASILAKVYRDRIMEEFDRSFPLYGFARHKGYPTAVHRKAVLEHGPCPIHRLSFTLQSGSGERLSLAELGGNGRGGMEVER